MEQPSMRPSQPRTRRTASLPPQGGRRPAPVQRPAERPGRPAPPLARALRSFVRAVRRMPDPRLTGIGAGLFCGGSAFLLACLVSLLFGGSLVVYGVLFLPVSTLTALWVRPADLVTAPITVPIAFAVGLLPLAESSGGLGDRIMGLATALAMHAGWLYGGTLIAGVIASVRKIRLMARRARQRRRPPAAADGGRPPAPRRRIV